MADYVEKQMSDGRVLRFPKGTSDDVIRRYMQVHWPDEISRTWGETALQFGRGVARAGAGFASELPDPAEWIAPQETADRLNRARQAESNWANDPNVSTPEELGRSTASVLPTAAVPELGIEEGAYGLAAKLRGMGQANRFPAISRLGRVVRPLGEMAEDMARAGIGGFVQPTQSNTLQSHWDDAKLAMGMGAIPTAVARGSRTWVAPYVAKRATVIGLHAAIAEAAHMAGASWWEIARYMGPITLWHMMHNNPLTRLAGRLPQAGAALRKMQSTEGYAPMLSMAGGLVGQIGAENQYQTMPDPLPPQPQTPGDPGTPEQQQWQQRQPSP